MNQHFDPSAFIFEQFEALGPADRCRALDMLHQVVGPSAPIAVFEDLSREAEDWAALTALQTQTVYIVAMWSLWPVEKRQECINWMIKNKNRKVPPEA